MYVGNRHLIQRELETKFIQKIIYNVNQHGGVKVYCMKKENGIKTFFSETYFLSLNGYGDIVSILESRTTEEL
jgi:hypothetical protein